jgi:hypothetical protein
VRCPVRILKNDGSCEPIFPFLATNIINFDQQFLKKKMKKKLKNFEKILFLTKNQIRRNFQSF